MNPLIIEMLDMFAYKAKSILCIDLSYSKLYNLLKNRKISDRKCMNKFSNYENVQ